MKPTSVDEMLAALGERENDDALRERAARALDRGGRHAEAVELLTRAHTLLNAHGRGELPCLCKRCLVPGDARAELASGERYRREFVAADRRVLFFWVPDALTRDAARVRSSVRTAMREWIWQRRRPDRIPNDLRIDRETREVILGQNPFTGQANAPMPPARTIVNPFRKEPRG